MQIWYSALISKAIQRRSTIKNQNNNIDWYNIFTYRNEITLNNNTNYDWLELNAAAANKYVFNNYLKWSIVLALFTLLATGSM